MNIKKKKNKESSSYNKRVLLYVEKAREWFMHKRVLHAFSKKCSYGGFKTVSGNKMLRDLLTCVINHHPSDWHKITG